MRLYENVRYLAASRGMTLPEYAKRIGLSRTTLYKWDRHMPSATVLDQIAKDFDVSIEFLIDSTNVPEFAPKDGTIDLKRLVDSEFDISYAGEKLDYLERQRVKDVLMSVFYEKEQREKLRPVVKIDTTNNNKTYDPNDYTGFVINNTDHNIEETSKVK